MCHVDGRSRVWRRRSEEYNPECIQHKVQGFGGSVMVWGGFSHDHKLPLIIIHGNLNAVRYRDEVLDVAIRPHFHAQRQNRPLLMDDNARPHRARVIDTYKNANNISSIEWPALSPDLNPDEHMWDLLQRRVNQLQPPVTTLQQLEIALVREWNNIPMTFCRKLVRSMPRRCQAVIQARGRHTRY